MVSQYAGFGALESFTWPTVCWLRPGVGDVVLPHVSVQPVGEVEEPAVFGHQQIPSIQPQQKFYQSQPIWTNPSYF